MNNTLPRAQTRLTRSQKILVTLFRLAEGSTKQIRFEDIAVGVYKTFPADFQLRGYPQYPDTGDIVHKPLYSELKKNGYVISGNKYFSLTKKGVTYGKQLIGVIKKDNNRSDTTKSDKLTADQQKELDRLKQSTAVTLYITDEKESILDIDFYTYLGVTVRTDKNSFLGRLSAVEDAIKATNKKNSDLFEELKSCHEYMLNKFKENIDYVKKSKGGRR